MHGDEIINARQFDQMTPDERCRVAAEGITNDLSKVDPSFLAGARRRGRELLEELDLQPPSR